ncbi:MAG: hypothetical protein K9J37_01535 [Saprospiraceae bacterium]|nr:hypothetical protein [Saprospiraceae bacterium]MCF8280275.1 hypothetical protein [Bacteroidales bacterium]MCF8439269.1 hypothetical protein [Saprospiraceae bacterium]
MADHVFIALWKAFTALDTMPFFVAVFEKTSTFGSGPQEISAKIAEQKRK